MKLRLCDFNYAVEAPVSVVPRHLINAPKIKSSSLQPAWGISPIVLVHSKCDMAGYHQQPISAVASWLESPPDLPWDNSEPAWGVHPAGTPCVWARHTAGPFVAAERPAPGQGRQCPSRGQTHLTSRRAGARSRSLSHIRPAVAEHSLG